MKERSMVRPFVTILAVVLMLIFLKSLSAEDKGTGPSDERLNTILSEIRKLKEEAKTFDNPEFHLLWAREAFRHGNIEGVLVMTP